MAKLKTLVKSSKKATATVRVSAGPCPSCKSDEATRIYSTKGQTRYAVCDNCGCGSDGSFKVIGPLSNQLVDQAIKLVENLREADIVPAKEGDYIVIDAKDAAGIIERFETYLP